MRSGSWNNTLNSMTSRKRRFRELEIDGDEVLDMESDNILDARVKELLVDYYKPMRS